MKKYKKTILKRVEKLLIKDPSGISADATLCGYKNLTFKEQNAYFKEAERNVWIELKRKAELIGRYIDINP